MKAVVIDGESLRGELKEPLKEAPNEGRVLFVTNQVSPELAAALEKHGVTFAARVESPMVRAFWWLAPILILGGVWAWMSRRRGVGGPGAGLMSIGKSKGKVSFLKDPKSYGRLGARMPKGVRPPALLAGAQGRARRREPPRPGATEGDGPPGRIGATGRSGGGRAR